MKLDKLVPYCILKPLALTNAYLEHHSFKGTHQTQMEASGFQIVPGTDKYLHIGDDFMVMQYVEEKRILPGSVVNDFLKERKEEFESREGYPPGRAVTRQLKDDVIAALLPKAFTKRDTVTIMVIPSQALLLVFGTPKLADNATACLRDAIGSLPIETVTPKMNMGLTMSNWLSQHEEPGAFMFGTSAVLIDKDEAKISIANQDLLTDEVKTIIDAGKQVFVVEMNYEPAITFKLNDKFQLLSLKYKGEADEHEIEDELSRVNHELGVASIWLKDLISQLVTVFGGYIDEVSEKMHNTTIQSILINQDDLEAKAAIEIEQRIAKAKAEAEAAKLAQQAASNESESSNNSVVISDGEIRIQTA